MTGRVLTSSDWTIQLYPTRYANHLRAVVWGFLAAAFFVGIGL